MSVVAPTVLVPKHAVLGQGFNARERLAADEAPGRPWNRTAGGWVADLTALHKFVILCPFCVPKFNPRQNQYEPWRRHNMIVGRCDGCKQVSTQARGYMHQANHGLTGEWERPRRGRWSQGR